MPTEAVDGAHAAVEPTTAVRSVADRRTDALRTALHRLIRCEDPVTRIAHFIDPAHLYEPALRIQAKMDRAANSSSIYLTNQIPLFEAVQDPAKLSRLKALDILPELEIDQLFEPTASPLASLFRSLEAAWPAGVVRLAHEGHRVPFGIVREWDPGSSALPHQDVLRRELPGSDAAMRIKRQLGVNIHVSEATGGELEVWSQRITDDEWATYDLPGSYGYPRSALGPPAVTVRPHAGDLVMLDTACVHAIRPVNAGIRITLSGFIGYVADDQPLVCWS